MKVIDSATSNVRFYWAFLGEKNPNVLSNKVDDWSSQYTERPGGV